MTNRQWRILLGAIGAGCTVAVAQPDVQAIPFAVTVLVIVSGVVAFLRAPDEAAAD